jgi:hypothetical protein
MDSFRARRHTIILALVAIAVSFGILTWSIVTLAGLSSSGAALRAAIAPDAVALTLVQETNAAAKSDFAGVADDPPPVLAKRLAAVILPSQADLKPAAWDNQLEWLRNQPFPSAAPTQPAPPLWQTAAIPSAPPAAEASREPVKVAAAIPSVPAAAEAPRESEEETAIIPPTASAARHFVRPRKTEPVQSAAAQPRKDRVAASQPGRSYTEKVVEQGDSGEISYHYRRRACTPGNMVDVCYMPPANRQRIVIERW